SPSSESSCVSRARQPPPPDGGATVPAAPGLRDGTRPHVAPCGGRLARLTFSAASGRPTIWHVRCPGGGQRDGSDMSWHHHGGPGGCGGDWDRYTRRAGRDAARAARRAAREAQRWGWPMPEPPQRETEKPLSPEEEALRRARQRAAAEAGFYAH